MIAELIKSNMAYMSTMPAYVRPTIAEVRHRLMATITDILSTVNNNEAWQMVMSNEVVFDGDACKYKEIAVSKSTDPHAIKKNIKKFARLLIIAKEILHNLEQSTTMMKRELYYRHSDMVENQDEFDSMVQEMSFRLKLPRHSIKFVDYR